MSSSNGAGLTLRAALAQDRYGRRRIERALFAYDEWKRCRAMSIDLDENDDERKENDDDGDQRSA